MPRFRSGELSGYGDWTGLRRARWRQPVAESAVGIGPMRVGDDPRRDSVMMQSPRCPVLAA